ncbi:MAG: efflux RND transporter periplasmic adaptor subunit, partial [Fimbriimonadales bacterium]
MNRSTCIALTLLAALALTGCVDRQAQHQAKKTQEIISDPTQVVSVLSVVPQSVPETLEITGQVATGEDASVGAKLSGKLVAVYVKDGDPVSAGQLIAVQDTSTLQAQLLQALAGVGTANSQLSQAIANARIGPAKSAAAVKQAQAQLNSALASLEKVKNGARKQERVQMDWQVKQAKMNQDIAQKDADRKQALFDQGAIPRSELEQALNALVLAQMQYNAAVQNQAMQNEGARPEDLSVAGEAVRSARESVQQAKDQQKLDVLFQDQVNSARSGLQSAKAQVDVARQAIADAQIRAPFAGRVSGKPAQPGQIVGSSTTIARIIGTSGAYFEGDVPEDQITRIRTGSPVSVSLTAIPGKTFGGHVAAINPLGSETGRLFSVRVSFDSFTAEIKPGMFAKGKITLNVIAGAIMVPTTAVVTYKDHPTVFVLSGTSAVKPLVVTTGLRRDDSVQITAGLSAGEKVVIRGQENLNDKSKVRVEEAKTTAAKT